MSLDVKFDPSITIVNSGRGYEIWQGGGLCHKTLAKGFKTEGQAVGWAIDNGYATVERNLNKQ